MIKRKIIAGTMTLLGVFTFAATLAWSQVVEPDQHGFVVAGPEDLAPREGGRVVNLIGDPREEGIYVIQITWAPGTGSRPHYHDQARYINILSGHWYVASGPESDVYDPDSMTRLGPGTFIYQPAYGHHYDMAKDEEVVVQIFGMGPVTTTGISEN